MVQDFTCPLKSIQTLEGWLTSPSDGQCPSCLLAPLASYYLGALEEAGENILADNLKSMFENSSPLTIAKNMDSIKKRVGDKLKQDLENLDCMAQVHKDA